MGFEDTLREYIEEQIAGMYTISMVIVESVDHETRRCEVSMKFEENILWDNVPIASPYVGDNHGVVWPVSQDDEGYVIHNRQPMSDGLEKMGHVEQKSDRRFEPEDAVLVPLIWNDEQTVPNHTPGEMLIAHDTESQSGKPAIYRMKPDGTIHLEAGEQSGATTEVDLKPDGSVVVTETGSGNVIEMGPNGAVTLGDPSNAVPMLNSDAVIQYQLREDTSDGSGGTTTETATISDPGTDNVDGK